MTTLAVGDTGIHLVTDHGAGTYPAYQAGSKLNIAKNINGSLATMRTGIPPNEAVSPALSCPQVSSFVWQNVEMCSAPNSGTGWGTEIYFSDSVAETSRHDFNAVESGKLGGAPPLEAHSKALAQGHTDATGENMIRIVKPSMWLFPGEETTPGFPALNTREVYDGLFRMTYTWGLAGDDHIIQLLLEVTIPTDPIIQSKTLVGLVPFFHYNPNYNVAGYTAKPFTTQEWVALADGATRAYGGLGTVSTTEVLMNYSADENFAMAAVYGAGALADSGSLSQGYKGLNGAGAFPYVNSYGFCAKQYPGGIPAGTVTIPIALCIGTRAELIGASGAVAVAAANLAAASYPT